MHRYAGVDGESVDGRYTLLAAASDDGWDDWIENPDGLSTVECLDFLCSLPPELLKWGFAFGYDVNMMLGDVPRGAIRLLHERGFVFFRQFRIEYVPSKKLMITKYEGRGEARVRVGGCTVWDMFTWQQSSFVTWIEKWELASTSEIETIRAMKAQRGDFVLEASQEIRDYCLAECRYLAKGARRLCELVRAAGIAVTGWYSPATISKALMKRNRVVDHLADVPEAIEAAVDAAFHGGRAELGTVGPVRQQVYSYDIRSAYPTEAVNLPCLACGRWVHRRGKDLWTNLTPTSLVRAHWSPRRRRQRWGGLPVKPPTGSLRWPTSGSGWFWGVEAIAANRHVHVMVDERWDFVPGCDHRPFAYLQSLYDQRAALKATGDPTEYVIKLALNATYGCLAEHTHRDGKVPKYRCMMWAGLITAGTRARLLDVLCDDVLMMATDGILSLSPLDCPPSDELGGWECSTYEEMLLCGTGIYFGRNGDEWHTTKTRGFEPGQLSREQLIELWQRDGKVGKLSLQRQRFVGMGTALMRIHGFYPPAERLWRQFITEELVKSLDLEPRRRWLNDDLTDGRTVAPTQTAVRRTAKQDEALRAKAHRILDKILHAMDVHQAEWDAGIARGEIGWITGGHVFMETFTADLLRWQDRVLKLERRDGSSVFDWADDPNL